MSFWRSDSTLFDRPRDLVMLDPLLAALEPQLPGSDALTLAQQANSRLDLRTLVELELGRGSFEASYALFRLPRNVFEGSAFNASNGLVEVAPSNQSDAVDLAKQGAGSALEVFLLDHEDQWQLLGNGAFNQTPLNFRHDPNYVYFLGVDDSLITVRDNPRSDLLKAPFDLSELTGPNPTGPIVYDRPLFNSASPNDALLAAGRDFLAQLFHLSTAVDVDGKPIVGVIAGESLAPWLEAFAASLTSPVLLRDDSTDDQIDASLVRRRTLLSASTLLSELQASPAALVAPGAAVETAAFSAPESISTTRQIGGIGVGSEVINSVELYKNLIPISGLETIQIPTDLFPSFKLNLGLLAAMNDQRLIQLLASPPAVDLVEESFAAALPAPLRTQTISATSAIKTTTNTELLWDVEPSSTKNGQLLGYQEAAKAGPGNHARITSDQQVVISSPVLGFTGDEAVAYGDFPRLEMAVVGQSGGPSNVYSAYWLPRANQDYSFQWLIANQAQFNDRSPETGGAANPLASMLTIALPEPLDVARISLELAAVPGQPNGGQPVLRSHLFKVNQYRKKSVGIDNPPLADIKLAGFDAGDYEIVDSRIVTLNGDQTYIDNYAGAVDFISFTPYFEIGSFDGKTSGHSADTFLTPLLNGASGVGLQLSIDDIFIRKTTSKPENYTLEYNTYILPGSELQVAAYQG